jgi:hypothetical protein
MLDSQLHQTRGGPEHVEAFRGPGYAKHDTLRRPIVLYRKKSEVRAEVRRPPECAVLQAKRGQLAREAVKALLMIGQEHGMIRLRPRGTLTNIETLHARESGYKDVVQAVVGKPLEVQVIDVKSESMDRV